MRWDKHSAPPNVKWLMIRMDICNIGRVNGTLLTFTDDVLVKSTLKNFLTITIKTNLSRKGYLTFCTILQD